ncbi:MAG: AraC family transcriptional regulator ligand-binding domain-containing protein, partial [Oleiphilaceae bacterium]|nr:AraC family transcriptional regulator ligand-binding domain-containing protein [Oleiphilaceae bacterium]
MSLNTGTALTHPITSHHVKALRPALQVMAELGHDAARCLKGTGIDPSTLESDQPKLDLDQEWHFYRQLLQLSGDPLLGLKLG